MKFAKTLIAAALFATAGSASAGLVTDGALTAASNVNNEMFLSAYDSVQGKTYNLALGVNFAQLAGPNLGFAINPTDAVNTVKAALVAYEGAGKDLSTDANWTAFKAGITNNANVSYGLFVGDANDSSIFITGKSTIVPNLDTTVTMASSATAIETHAAEINAGMGAATSSLINDLPANPFIGQMNHLGLNSAEIWGGWGHNPLQTYGQSANLYEGGYSYLLDSTGTPVNFQFAASDSVLVGQFTLSGNSLVFSAPVTSAVPLPAAVWMFGTGLMGVLRATRRKAVEA